MANQIALLVLGMHRSGTSALAGLTTILGAVPPARLIEATNANPLGYWESAAIAAENEATLNRAGCGWDDSLLFDPERLSAEECSAATARCAALLWAEFRDAALYVLKDPRLCLLIDLWLPVLPSPRALLCLRHPAEVAASLSVRNKTPPLVTAALWLHHMLEAEARTRHLPRAFISFDRLLHDWRSAMAYAGTLAMIPWAPDPLEVATLNRQMLDDRLRHHVSPQSAIVAPDPLGAWTETVWNALRAIEAAPGTEEINARRLDDVRAAFAAWRRLRPCCMEADGERKTSKPA